VSRRRGTYLDRILDFHRERVATDRRDVGELIAEAQAASATRGFEARLRADASSSLAVISEVKRRSPSKGDLAADLDPVALARDYEQGGASCLSVLTDEPHFGGSAEDLRSARRATSLPVLRKDFTVGERDVLDARIMGADCVLLIVAALDPAELENLAGLSRSLAMDVLVEIHDEVELAVAVEIGATMIGVNQRDLTTFEVDHDRAVRMGSVIPTSVLRVAESGVRGSDDAGSLRRAGYDAVLVGETLVRAADVASTIRSLRVV
jgi:indole-3-glycerol phosphate synthase